MKYLLCLLLSGCALFPDDRVPESIAGAYRSLHSPEMERAIQQAKEFKR